MTRKGKGLRGSLPSKNKKPNRHRLGAWEPPFQYPNNSLTREEKSQALRAYNAARAKTYKENQ